MLIFGTASCQGMGSRNDERISCKKLEMWKFLQKIKRNIGI